MAQIETMSVRAKEGAPWPKGDVVVINANEFDPTCMEAVQGGRARLADADVLVEDAEEEEGEGEGSDAGLEDLVDEAEEGDDEEEG